MYSLWHPFRCPERSGLAVSSPSLNLQLPEQVLASRKGPSILVEYTTKYWALLWSPHQADPAPKSHLGQSEMGDCPTENSASCLDAIIFSFGSDPVQLKKENRSLKKKCPNLQNHEEELSTSVLKMCLVPLLLFTVEIQPSPVKIHSTLTLPGWSSPNRVPLSQSHTQASLKSANKVSSNTNHPPRGQASCYP